MPTQNKQIVGTYGDLVELFENWIISIPSNAGNWKSNVPASFKNGWVYSPWSHGTGHNNNTAKITYTTARNLDVVSTSTIISQFRDYMKLAANKSSTDMNNTTSRSNMQILTNTIVTATEVVWLLSHVINFAIHKFVIVTNNFAPNIKVIMYNPNNAVSTSNISNKILNGVNINSVYTKEEDINTLITELNNALINKLKITTIKYNKSFTSSSSCSSSSSSSSSMFIAHVS